MEEQLITFETAKTAKEKGFDWESSGLYDEKCILGINHLNYKRLFTNSKEDTYNIAAPTQALLQKWLRKKKEIYIHVAVWRNMDHCDEFTSIITKPAYIKPLYDKGNKGLDIMESKAVAFKYTYEEALEAGLQEGLKLISNEL
jgi:hypothetical protein